MSDCMVYALTSLAVLTGAALLCTHIRNTADWMVIIKDGEGTTDVTRDAGRKMYSLAI